MPYYFYIWDGVNEEHLAEHGITIDEFIHVVSNPHRLERSSSSGRWIAFGYVEERYLACVYEQFDEFQIYPITAYEIEENL
ncbi:MAG: hypothetical protein SFX18_05095 [Pirellulales bacterium]|nr:hypothetical protein [Pirellulales bacterium]